MFNQQQLRAIQRNQPTWVDEGGGDKLTLNQTGIYGLCHALEEVASAKDLSISERLDRLVGKRVRIKGNESNGVGVPEKSRVANDFYYIRVGRKEESGEFSYIEINIDSYAMGCATITYEPEISFHW